MSRKYHTNFLNAESPFPRFKSGKGDHKGSENIGGSVDDTWELGAAFFRLLAFSEKVSEYGTGP